MQLITEDYRKLNEEKHKTSKEYGTSGVYYLDDVISLIKLIKSQDLLDYGCGKGTLSNNLPFSIKQYDPCVKKHSALPEPADTVVCTDVLEHIEPELIDNVLTHIASLMKVQGYLSASTVAAKKTLADGRNAHILLHDKNWWVAKISEFFEIGQIVEAGSNVIFIVKPKAVATVFIPEGVIVNDS